MNFQRTTGASLLVVLLMASGCGADDAAEPSKGDRETTAETTSEGVVVARARLRASKALGPQAHGEPFPGFDYSGPEQVIVEVKRADEGRFVLVMQGITHDLEPHTLRLATSTTCTEYAQRGDQGKKIFQSTLYGEGDAAQGGTVHERQVWPVTDEAAAKLLAEPVTAFADSGGAHGGDYIFCGTLETKQP